MTDDPFDRPSASSGELEPDGTRAPMDKGRYLLPLGKDGKATRHTRATNFAKSIADTYLLSLWQQRMAIKGITMDAGLYAKTAATSLDDRKTLNEIVEDAKGVAGARTRASLGTALHTFTERWDRGELDLSDVPPPWDRDVAEYDKALADLGLEPARLTLPCGHELWMSELTVYVPKYAVAGTFDRLARVTKPLTVKVRDPKAKTVTEVSLKPGDLVVLDLKTGRTLDFGWPEIAVQLSLYANAETFFCPECRTMHAMPDVDKRVALVVHLPVGEARATVYGLNIETGWTACWLIEQVRTFRRLKDVHAVVYEDKAEPYAVEPETLADGPVRVAATRVPSTEAWLTRIEKAPTLNAVRLVLIEAERSGLPKGQLTPLYEAARLRRDELEPKALTS